MLAKRVKLREGVRGIARLELRACKIQDTIVDVTERHVVVMMPHAHVSPDDSLACLRFGAGAKATISVCGRV